MGRVVPSLSDGIRDDGCDRRHKDRGGQRGQGVPGLTLGDEVDLVSRPTRADSEGEVPSLLFGDAGPTEEMVFPPEGSPRPSRRRLGDGNPTVERRDEWNNHSPSRVLFPFIC